LLLYECMTDTINRDDVDKFVKDNREVIVDKYMEEIAKEAFARHPSDVLDIVLKEHQQEFIAKFSELLYNGNGDSELDLFHKEHLTGLKEKTRELYPNEPVDSAFKNNMQEIYDQYILDNIEETREYMLYRGDDIAMKVCKDNYSETIVNQYVYDNRWCDDIIATAFINSSVIGKKIKGSVIAKIYNTKTSEVENNFQRLYHMDAETALNKNAGSFITTVFNYHGMDIAKIIINDYPEIVQKEMDKI